MKTILIFISVLSLNIVFSQSIEERREITKDFNTAEESLIQSELAKKYSEAEQRVAAYLASRYLKRSFTENNRNYFLKDVVSGEPIYLVTQNRNSSRTIKTNELYSGGSLGLNIQGQGMIAGVWDGGIARATHQELTNRITSYDGSTNEVDHATHVSGTIIASGVEILAKGIAFEAEAYCSDWTNDHSEMLSFSGQGYLVSNHSYGYDASNLPLWYFGAYNSDSRSIDLIANLRPYYTIVYASGNDRDNFGSLNPTKGGYDLITGDSAAKNAITVGATNQVLNYQDASSVVMSSFSNWGPTDDGRIKPDCIAKGVSVYSSTASSNSSYASFQGTSMAAPAIAGMVLLLQQYYNQLNGNYMKSASVKGLILHTTKEAGGSDGPDYKFGWGLPDAEIAANLITNNGTDAAKILETTLSNASTYTTVVDSNGTEPLQVSISWTDPAGTANNGTVDDPTPALVNDLDLKVEQGGTTYYPWKLNVSSPASPATNSSTNDVDNFERVDILNPSGQYTVTVSHKGSLQGGDQDYTLIVSGGTVLGVDDIDAATRTFEIYPNPVSDFLKIKSDTDLRDAEVSIFNTNGQLVQSTVLNADNQLEVSSLESGNYVLVINTNGEKLIKKFIKK